MRLILALIGIALIVIGALTEADAIIAIGAILILFCILLLVWKLAKKANDTWVTGQDIRQEEIEQEEREYEKTHAHINMRQSMSDSELPQRVLAVICPGAQNRPLPSKITITFHNVQATYINKERTYNFQAHADPIFSDSPKFCNAEEEKYLPRPMVALAELLNESLNNAYSICDTARREYQHHVHFDGEPYRIEEYTPDTVIMTLEHKPKTIKVKRRN